METAAHHSGLAVVAMPLVAVDRRALSQAWYDAMHLVEHRPPVHAHTGAPLATPAFASRARTGAKPSPARRPAPLPEGVARREVPARSEAFVERRSIRTTLGRKIAVRLAALPPSAPKRLAFSAAGGRVQIVVRGEGAQARIIAICAPALRERVARALLEARYQLGSHGIATETTVRERIAC